MKRKQLLAILMTGALSVGMIQASAFAEEVVMETSGEEVPAQEEAPLEEAVQETPVETVEEVPAEEETVMQETTEESLAETVTEVPAEIKDTASVQSEDVPAAQEGETPATENGPVMIGDASYSSLAEAVAAVPDNTPTTITISGEIQIAETVTVPVGKNIILQAKDETGALVKRADGFTGDIFSISGSMAVYGSGTPVEGGNVNGSFVLDGNGTDVTGTSVRVNSGAAFSVNGTFNCNGQISGPDENNSAEVILEDNGTLNVGTGFIGSAINLTINNPEKRINNSVPVVSVDPQSTDLNIESVLEQISYTNDSYQIGDDGKLALKTTASPSPSPSPSPTPSNTPTPTPTIAEQQLKIKGKSVKWISYNGVRIVIQSNVKGTYYVDWVNKGAQAPTIDISSPGKRIEAGKDTSIEVTGLPENDVDIYVCVVSDKDKNNYNSLKFQPISAERPAAPVTETPSPTPTSTPHNAKVPSVTESIVQGFENPLTFYPNTFYEFRVVGAGTDNTDPGKGDVRWVPLYWSMSSNPGSNDRHSVWKIGAQSGIYTDENKTYTMYIFFQKEVYDGEQWQEEKGSAASVPYQFVAAPLSRTSITPTVEGNGTGTGTDYDDSYITPATYGDGTDASTKSAVSTADESPIGTMMALAAASLLAGGYVLVRRRKKEF